MGIDEFRRGTTNRSRRRRCHGHVNHFVMCRGGRNFNFFKSRFRLRDDFRLWLWRWRGRFNGLG